MKLKLVVVAAVLAMASGARAASYYVNNVVAGDSTDTLIMNSDGALNGGIVAIGYFTGGAPSSSIADIATTIANFNLQASVLAGSYSPDLDASVPGYFQMGVAVSGADILAGSPLIGQNVYLFAGNASTLAASTTWGIVKVGTYIQDNPPLINQYTANTSSALVQSNIIMGSVGTLGANSAFQLFPIIPEPSAMLLGAVGALGLLRRRRA